ncbi:hypothetical protein ABDB91_17445 [Desulfoscipio sp. XC116]|uniref:hypothetical protein n=1 Tax=Desulfoscipio sp. XC116 TaxID=3144975 RepID=UPI00325B8F10
MPRRVITAPCENCHYKNGAECFNVLALLKTARAMELELYNHGVEDLVAEFVIPCKNYVPEAASDQKPLKRII